LIVDNTITTDVVFSRALFTHTVSNYVHCKRFCKHYSCINNETAFEQHNLFSSAYHLNNFTMALCRESYTHG